MKKDIPFNLRFSQPELDLVKAAAKFRGQSASEFLRWCAVKFARTERLERFKAKLEDGVRKGTIKQETLDSAMKEASRWTEEDWKFKEGVLFPQSEREATEEELDTLAAMYKEGDPT